MVPNSRIVDEEMNQLTFRDILETSELFMYQYINNIMQGNFRHTKFPTHAACSDFCEFRRICRKDIRKLTSTN